MKRIMFAFFLIVLVVIAGCTLLLLSQTGNQTTEDPDDSNTAVLADYTVTIPEIYELGFGVAEINMRFIASSPSLQEEQLVSEANFTTTKLPTTFSTKPNNRLLSLRIWTWLLGLVNNPFFSSFMWVVLYRRFPTKCKLIQEPNL